MVRLYEFQSLCVIPRPKNCLASDKRCAQVYSPVAGEVVEVNSKLADEPDMINKSAESNGWIAKV
jgi:glycine cleavage system H protein